MSIQRPFEKFEEILADQTDEIIAKQGGIDLFSISGTAKHLGLSETDVFRLVDGKVVITPEIASRLESQFAGRPTAAEWLEADRVWQEYRYDQLKWLAVNP
jgi:plasmid maintenance system antidote protein VapI